MVDIITDDLIDSDDFSFQIKNKLNNSDSKILNQALSNLFDEFKKHYPEVIDEIMTEELNFEEINNSILELKTANKLLANGHKNIHTEERTKELIKKEQQIDKMTLQLYDTLEKLIDFCIKHEKVLYR